MRTASLFGAVIVAGLFVACGGGDDSTTSPNNDAGGSDAGGGGDGGHPGDAGGLTDGGAKTDSGTASDGGDAGHVNGITIAGVPATGFSRVLLGTMTVTVLDAMGKTDVAYNGNVTLSVGKGPASGALSGTTTVLAVNGVATFGDIACDRQGNYVLSASTASAFGQSTSIAVDAWAPFDTGAAAANFTSIAVHPTNPDIAYGAANGGGIWGTTNGATASPTWKFLALPGSYSAAIVIDPKTPTTLYAGNGAKGVYKSIDAGATWAAANAGHTSDYVQALAIDPVTPTTLYWGTNTAFLKSVDAGKTWSAPAVAPGFGAAYIHAIAVSKHNPQVLYVMAGNQGVWKSADAGATFTALNAGFPATLPSSQVIAIDPTDETNVFTGDASGAGGVYHSTGGGAWTAVLGNIRADATVEGIAFDPADKMRMYISDYGKDVFKSTDGGASWKAMGYPSYPFRLTVAPSNADIVYVGLYSGAAVGIYHSLDAAATWQNSGSGLAAFLGNSVALDPKTSGIAFFGGGYINIRKTADGGKTFANLTGPALNGDEVIGISPSDPNVVYVGSNGVGMSVTTTKGAPFALTGTGNVSFNAICTAAANPDVVFAGTAYGLGIFVTTNGTQAGGATWTNPAAVPGTANACAVDPANANVAYMAMNNGLYKTIDMGQTWAALAGTTATTAVVVDPTNANIVFAAYGGTVHRSADAGATWAAAGVGLPSAASVLAIDAAHPQTLLAGTSQGVWRTTTAGTLWTSSGVAGWAVKSAAIDPQDANVAYVGLDGGGFMKSVSGGM